MKELWNYNNMKRTVGIIQARIGSTRLPYKMMLSLHGIPIIQWVIRRVQKSKLLDDLIVAIPVTEDNDLLEKYLKELNVEVYRGSEGNVLERFYESAKLKEPLNVVRICADNPLIDGLEIDNLIDFFEKNQCDYAYNHIPKENLYPDGLGAEIVKFTTLEHLYEVVETQHHKEHSLSYITENSDKFDIKTFDPLDKELHNPQLRFDIDSFEDYKTLCMKEININTTSKELIKIFLEK